MIPATLTLENGVKVNYEIDNACFFQYVIADTELSKLKQFVIERERNIRRRKGNRYKEISTEKLVSGYLAEKLVEEAVRSKFKDKHLLVMYVGDEEEEYDIKIIYKDKLVGNIQVKSKPMNWVIDYEDFKRGKVPSDEIKFTLGNELKYAHMNKIYNPETDFYFLVPISDTLTSNNVATSAGFGIVTDLTSMSVKKEDNIYYCYYPKENKYNEMLDQIAKNIKNVDESCK